MTYPGRAKYPATIIIGDAENEELFNVLGINPHVELNLVFTWVSGKPTQIIITGLGKTKTMTLSWTGDELNSIACVIT